MRNRTHVSFRREQLFTAQPHTTEEVIADPSKAIFATRENILPGCYLLRSVMSAAECKSLIRLAESIGFTHAGLAIGNDTYRVNLASRNNTRVVLDSTELANTLWTRVSHCVTQNHENRHVVGLNWRFRVYRYEVGQRFFPHVDVRTDLSVGQTRFSFVIYLNDDFEGGSTRFFEQKNKESRRNTGRSRKFDNKVIREVRAPVGGAVVFDHLLLHEGAVVTEGVKYAVRSDLIYRSPCALSQYPI